MGESQVCEREIERGREKGRGRKRVDRWIAKAGREGGREGERRASEEKSIRCPFKEKRHEARGRVFEGLACLPFSQPPRLIRHTWGHSAKGTARRRDNLSPFFGGGEKWRAKNECV